MKELTLQEIKSVELEILSMFDEFCKKNSIKYFISNGTLLGAVKYKGFIPWDDDVDLLVPREDYNRLLKLFKDSDRYRIFAIEKDKNYRYPFAKLCDMTTRKDEFGYDNGLELGVDIDIFPLDYWDNDLENAKREVRKINKSMFGLTLSKLRKPDSKNPLKRIAKGAVMLYCKMRGSNYYINKIIRDSVKEEQKGSAYIGNKVWCIYGVKEIIPAEVFEKTLYLEFEGKSYPAPIGYDAYLKSLYGEYRADLPKDKQVTHHRYNAYRI